METLKEKIARVVKEEIEIRPYDPAWPAMFEDEKACLQNILAKDLFLRIEHFGSTAVPGLPAKPVVDILVEVVSLNRIKAQVPPVLEPRGYDYFWRPTSGDTTPPFYAWFIKRDQAGRRTHHIHMVEKDYPQWEGLLFRDFLRTHPETANAYAALKKNLAIKYPGDRVAYTRAKTEFVRLYTDKARALFSKE